MKLGVRVSFTFFLCVISCAIGVIFGQQIVAEFTFIQSLIYLRLDSFSLSLGCAIGIVVCMLTLSLWDARRTAIERKKEEARWKNVVVLSQYRSSRKK